jgi:hypothetical protein
MFTSPALGNTVNLSLRPGKRGREKNIEISLSVEQAASLIAELASTLANVVESDVNAKKARKK